MKIKGHEIIFQTIVGSQSYGTAIEGSDVDRKGVYIQDPQDVYVNGYKEQLEITKDETYYEIGRFLSLLQTGNPTMLELLYAPKDCIEYCSPIFQKVIDSRDIFITKALRFSFGGYAIEQIKKAGGLQKKMNWEKEKIERKAVEDMCYVYQLPQESTVFHIEYKSSAIPLNRWLADNGCEKGKCGLVKLEHFRDCYLLFYGDAPFFGISSGENANDVCISIVPKQFSPLAMLFFNRDAYSIHCKEYREYTAWLEKRNTQRYVDIKGHGQKIDGKNILHCVRLIETAMEIPASKAINVRRPNAEYLIGIRKGKYDLKTLLTKCEADIQSLDSLFVNSDLPEKVDKNAVDKLIKQIKTDYYGSYFQK